MNLFVIILYYLYIDVEIFNLLFWVIYKIYVLIKYNVYVNYIVKCVNFMIMFIKLKLLYFWWNSFLSIYDFRFLVRFILESYCMDMIDDVLKLLIWCVC